MPEQPANRPPKPDPVQWTARPRVVLLEELMQGATEILIRHVGEDYRLRITRNGKLILFK